MNKFTYIIIPILCCFSCASTKVVATAQRDSVRVEIMERFVEVRDTVKVEIPKIVEVAKIRQDSSSLINDYSRSEAKILPDGVLYHSLETIPQEIIKPAEFKVTVRDSIVYRDRKVINTLEVERDLTAWQRWQMSGFWALLALITILVIIKIKL